MPLFGWSAPGQLREMSNERAHAPTITEPARPAALPQDKTLYRCKVESCGQKFRKPMILARHFNTNHEDLRQDKESWRAYSEEVTE